MHYENTASQEPLVEMTATLNVVVSINLTTVMQTYWTASCRLAHVAMLASGFNIRFLTDIIFLRNYGLLIILKKMIVLLYKITV